MKFERASSLLWSLLRVGVESVLMACMGSVSAPSSAMQGSQESKRYQACATSKRETRQMSRKRVASLPFKRVSTGRSLGGRRAMLALVSAVNMDLVEGKCE